MKRSRLLVVTTTEDISLPLFFSHTIQKQYIIHVILINSFLEDTDYLSDISTDYLYIRDVFNDNKLNTELMADRFNEVVNNISYKKSIDSIKKLPDILIEDKWIQYQQFKKYMPLTWLESNKSKYSEVNDIIIKKRISSRSKDIYFNTQGIEESQLRNFIFQEKIIPVKEYRINCIRKRIMPDILVKSNKALTGKTKVIGCEKISNRLENYAAQIIENTSLDLAGLDILEDITGKYYLLEINRSPQILNFYKQTAVNLFEELLL